MASVIDAQNFDGNESEDDNEEFVDAEDKIQISSSITLHQGIIDCYQAMVLFLNNKFEDAKRIMLPLKDKSMYHALGYCTNMFLQAMLTFEEADIEAGKEATKQASHLINKCRHKSSILSRTDYNSYTAEEIHAELCYAESLIHRTLLTFIQDENLISFIKGGLRLRQCHLSYKECIKILQKRKFVESDEKIHFESGTRMGDGMSNLLLSLLPSKVLKLLEFIGFSGSKVKGLNELETGHNLDKSLRGVLCALALLTYHTVITFLIGTEDGDIALADKILKQWLKQYSKSAIFLFFAGRTEEVKGNIRDAIYRFEESVDAQQEWKNFQHLCFWELMWCHSFQGDWVLAMKYAERLCNESKWSKATYMYQKACFLMMCEDQSEETKRHIEFILGEVPKLKQRIAGKSIPVEKFAVKKAARYFEQQRALVLPAYELFFIWNSFTIFGNLPEYVNPILTNVEKALTEIERTKDKRKFYADDRCLALLLKGVCLRCRQQYEQAEKCLREVTQCEKEIKDDDYLVPYAHHEIALIRIAQGKFDEAKSLLDKIKKDYKGYQIESRLHFRLHTANMKIKKLKGEAEDGEVAVTPTPSRESSVTFGDVAVDQRL